MLRTLKNEPLVHFLAIGLFMFWLLSMWQPPESDYQSNTLVIDRKGLNRFFQYQASIPDPEKAAVILSSSTEQERQRIIDAYVREEVLFREGIALGLDQNDRAIRQRIVQKTKFALEAFAVESAVPADDQLKAFYSANQADYRVEPTITFSHVFFSYQKQGEAVARQRALQSLEALRANASHSAALGYGDRFLYNRNYVERPQEDIASHFGNEMAANLFSLSTEKQSWQGPIESEYGVHLVLISGREKGYTPELEKVRDQVVTDFLFERRQQQLNAAIETLVQEYEVELEYQPQAGDYVQEATTKIKPITELQNKTGS